MRSCNALILASASCRSACSVSIILAGAKRPWVYRPLAGRLPAILFFEGLFYIRINDPGTFTISNYLLPVTIIVSNKFFFSDDGLSIMVIIVNIVMKIALILLFIDC